MTSFPVIVYKSWFFFFLIFDWAVCLDAREMSHVNESLKCLSHKMNSSASATFFRFPIEMTKQSDNHINPMKLWPGLTRNFLRLNPSYLYGFEEGILECKPQN